MLKRPVGPVNASILSAEHGSWYTCPKIHMRPLLTLDPTHAGRLATLGEFTPRPRSRGEDDPGDGGVLRRDVTN